MHDFDLFDYERVLKRNCRVASFIAGRGCPFDCSYCCNHALKKLYKHKVRRIHFDDDSFTLSKKWVSEFCEKYPQKFDLEFEYNIRVGTIEIGTLSELRAAGCRKISIGVECGNESFRKNILKRDMTNKQIIDVFKDASEIGIEPTSFNMFGFPFETPEIVEETVAFNKQISPSEIQFSIFYPYPGTDLYNLCEKRGYLRHTLFSSYFETSSALKLPNLSEQDIKKYYWQFDDFSVKTYISTNYPWLSGIHKLIRLIFGHRTKGLLIFFKKKSFISGLLLRLLGEKAGLEANARLRKLQQHLTLLTMPTYICKSSDTGGSAFSSIRNRLARYEKDKENILKKMEKLREARSRKTIEISEEIVRDRIPDISKVLANGDPQRVKEELRRNIREIVAFPEGKVRIEIDPEGVLGKGKIEFCPRGCRRWELNPHGG